MNKKRETRLYSHSLCFRSLGPGHSFPIQEWHQTGSSPGAHAEHQFIGKLMSGGFAGNTFNITFSPSLRHITLELTAVLTVF